MKKTPPPQEYRDRVEKLKIAMKRLNVDLALILQNADRYYFSGTVQDGVLIVWDEEPVLLIRRTFQRAKEESPLKEIHPVRGLREVRNFIKEKGIKVRNIGVAMDTLPTSLYLTLCSYFDDAKMIDLSEEIRRIRAVKSDFERSLIKEGGRRLDRVFKALMGDIKPGLTEYEIYKKMVYHLVDEEAELFIRTRTFNMDATSKILLSGKSASKHSAIDSPSAGGDGISIAFPSGPGMKIIRRNEPVIVDLAFCYQGYIVDCTRIFSHGSLERFFVHAHHISKQCHELFIEGITNSISISELYRKMWNLVEKEGLSEVFMGGVNFIGHGVGLELDELPVISGKSEGKIEEGMVIALEPKFVFPEGTVGYEDTYCIESGEVVPVNKFESEINYL